MAEVERIRGERRAVSRSPECKEWDVGFARCCLALGAVVCIGGRLYIRNTRLVFEAILEAWRRRIVTLDCYTRKV